MSGVLVGGQPPARYCGQNVKPCIPDHVDSQTLLDDNFLIRYDWSPGFLEDGILEASFLQESYYVPMIWGKSDLEEGRLLHISRVGENSSYLLGFNEPNYNSQVTQRIASESAADNNFRMCT